MGAKIIYTQEMQEQDKLWETEKEDLNVMERLYKEIVEQAIKNGFKGVTYIYDANGEKLIEVFENQEQQKLASLGKVEADTFGYCKPLIEHLESMLTDQNSSQCN